MLAALGGLLLLRFATTSRRDRRPFTFVAQRAVEMVSGVRLVVGFGPAMVLLIQRSGGPAFCTVRVKVRSTSGADAPVGASAGARPVPLPAADTAGAVAPLASCLFSLGSP
eukprot:11444981-Heterocapsa_arctica.AAC.1